jgi:pimeloyl-ACP methyl ester carboxylesterase
MSVQEHAAVFGVTSNLVGVITDPQGRAGGDDAAGIAAICLNAGVIHRVGPSRLHVSLARRLASAGWTAVRFDHSGIGDSPARRDGLPFEQSAILETREVMDALEKTRGIRRFVLMGLCSGAVTAFETAAADERVAGAVLINPQGFDASPQWNSYVQNRGDARRYWTRSLFSASSWWNALTGRVKYRRLWTVLWRQATGMSEAQDAVATVAARVGAMLRTVLGRNVRLLMLCSEGDDGLDYMNVILGQDIRAIAGGEHLSVQVMSGADHSLTLRASQQDVVDRVCGWAARLPAPPPAGEPAARTSVDSSPEPELSVSR